MFQMLKFFVITIALLMLLQVEVQGRSLESHLLTWIYTSKTSKYIVETANGAVKYLSNSSKTIKKEYFSNNAKK